MIIRKGTGPTSIGKNRIGVVLKEQGRSSKWLAVQTSISRTQISGYVTNKNQPSLDNAFKIACALGVQMESLVWQEVA